MNGKLSMTLKKNLDLDDYFKFLEEYFKLFEISNIKRRKIKGNNFKL